MLHRVEEHPPWDSRCEFYRLRRQCQEFKASLPRQHTLTPQNTQAHISLKTSTPYTLVHTVYLLCQIMLHREYVPFIPLRCSRPEGPLDPPVFPPERFDVPPGFWGESARECFRSAREIMDLVRTCQEWSALVETPIVGFAIYTVAFVGVYCINFPWMDPEGYMCTRPDPTAGQNGSKPGESKGFEAARKALEMIGFMRTKLHMADGWFKTINRVHKWLRKIKSDYKKNSQAIESSSEGDSPVSNRHLSLREGGLGGGLDEFKLLERTLNDFGNLDDDDVEMGDAQRTDNNKALDAVYDDSSAGTTVKSEEAGDRPPHVPEPSKNEGGAWSAINATPGAASASRQPSMSAPANGTFRTYEAYPQAQQQQPREHPQHPQHPQHHHHTAPPQGHPQQQPSSYQHSISNFRPAYSEGPSPGGAPPSLTSPASQSATGTTPSQTQPSPPFDRLSQQQNYPAWAAQNGTYGMPPPPPNPYTTNGPVQHHYPTPNHVGTSQSPYPAPGQPVHSAQHHNHGMQHPPLPEVQQAPVWDPMTKEAWLNSIDTRLGGDDVAAFVDGGEMAEWATLAATQGFGGGWLSAVWQGGHT